jgi:hypothetical protein
MYVAFALCFAQWGVFAQDTGAVVSAPAAKRILVVYEEANGNISPWVSLFHSEAAALNCLSEEVPVADIESKRLADYDGVIVFGSVMAFTQKEPIRDWLRRKPSLQGPRYGVFVTANRWFLKKYYDEVVSLLSGAGISPVDAVSSATQKLSDGDKRLAVRQYLRDFVAVD